MPLMTRKVNEHPVILNICGLPFEVKELDTNELSSNNIGRSCFEMLEINIAKGLRPALKQQTLIHEWVHMVLASGSFTDECSDEKLVCLLSNELYRSGFRLEVKEIN